MCADAFDRPLQVVRYTASECANCAHAVDLWLDRELRSPGGRNIKRWTICELGLWAGRAVARRDRLRKAQARATTRR